MTPGAAIQRLKRQRNQELLQYVADHGSCSFEELLGMFGEPSAAGEDDTRLRFSKRISYLADRRKLKSLMVDGVRHWTLPPVQAAEPSDVDHAANRTPPDTRACSVAEPRRISVLHGPLYVPAPSAVLRTGALDYKKVASHGVRC